MCIRYTSIWVNYMCRTLHCFYQNTNSKLSDKIFTFLFHEERNPNIGRCFFFLIDSFINNWIHCKFWLFGLLYNGSFLNQPKNYPFFMTWDVRAGIWDVKFQRKMEKPRHGLLKWLARGSSLMSHSVSEFSVSLGISPAVKSQSTICSLKASVPSVIWRVWTRGCLWCNNLQKQTSHPHTTKH